MRIYMHLYACICNYYASTRHMHVRISIPGIELYDQRGDLITFKDPHTSIAARPDNIQSMQSSPSPPPASCSSASSVPSSDPRVVSNLLDGVNITQVLWWLANVDIVMYCAACLCVCSPPCFLVEYIYYCERLIRCARVHVHTNARAHKRMQIGTVYKYNHMYIPNKIHTCIRLCVYLHRTTCTRGWLLSQRARNT